MSSPMIHTIQSLATSAALYPVMGEQVVPFGLAVIFIDIDHFVGYMRDTGSYDPRGIFTYCKVLQLNLDKKFLVYDMFHTIEFFLLMFCLSILYPGLLAVFAGMVYHILFDMIHMIRIGSPFGRAFSLIEYLWRRRNGAYITSIRGLLQREDLSTAGIADFDSWVARWDMEQNRKRGGGKEG